MPVISARGLSKAYGNQTLFSDVSLTIARGERVGLLGINGTGKSTLLRVLAGVETADAGTVDRRRGATILYLAQEPDLDPGLSPRAIVLHGLAEWKEATTSHAEITRRIEQEGASDALVQQQSLLAERVDALGGWSRSHEAELILSKLGVKDIDRPVGTMSGGERRRVALAHVLVARPTLAILDEPTNHLDTATIDWLEEYLIGEHEGAVLLVTHDRYVLDAICDRILELDRAKLQEYRGGYGDYLDQKAERLAHEDRAEANRLNLLRREKAWLMRGAKARSTKQKARIQRAEAVIAAEPWKPPLGVDLAGLERGASDMGKSVLDLEGVSVTVAGKVLVKDLTLHLVVGDRVGVIGPNGAGKTSLLRVITGELAVSSGKVVMGTRTKIALFDQARAELRDDWSILDNVAEREGAERTGAGSVVLGKETIEVRAYLERFLFDPSKQRQKVGALSGGERARVALAKILKGGANLLLLDEPTNDLDIATLSALEELLESWPGCVLAVSHDRYFLDRVGTSILSFEPGGRVVRYPGGYSAYRQAVETKETEKRSASKPPPQARAESKGLTYAERLEYEGILDLVAAAERRVAEAERTLSDPALYASQPADVQRVRGELEHAQAEVARLMARWEALESRRA